MRTLQDKNFKIQRANALKELKEHHGWKNYIEPELKKKIEENSSITRIDVNNVERSYIKQKVKYDTYQGILSLIDTWINEGINLEKE